jgi:hypothetical protein
MVVMQARPKVWVQGGDGGVGEHDSEARGAAVVEVFADWTVVVVTVGRARVRWDGPEVVFEKVFGRANSMALGAAALGDLLGHSVWF